MSENFAVYETKFGLMEIAYENDVILRIKKTDKAEHSGIKTKLSDKVYKQLTEYFHGDRKTFDFKYELRGTIFQKKVWQALLSIPYGETRTYKDIAQMIGNEKACRAVGMANNKNPIGIVVPCHRVIGTGGKLVGYASGLEMKADLLKMENENK